MGIVEGYGTPGPFKSAGLFREIGAGLLKVAALAGETIATVSSAASVIADRSRFWPPTTGDLTGRPRQRQSSFFEIQSGRR
jgi:hypothetical protein